MRCSLAVGVIAVGTLLAIPSAAQVAETGAIVGRVVNADGMPLAGAVVHLEATSGTYEAVAETDEAGQYAFGSVPPGVLSLSASLGRAATNRYGLHAPREYGAVRPGGPGTPVRVDSGQRVESLDIVLVASGRLSGTVRSPAGEPAMASVWIFEKEWDRYEYRLKEVAQMTTGESGEYSTMLSPGQYVVAAEAALSRRTMEAGVTAVVLMSARHRTWYPGVREARSAAPVVVTSSTEARAIDITLQSPSTARVTVLVEAPGHAVSGVSADMWFMDASSPRLVPRMVALVARDVTPPVLFSAVPAGRFDYVASGYVEGRKWWAKGVLTTDGASDIVEEATLNPPGTITGRVSFAAPSDDPVFPGIRMRLVGDASLPPAMRRFVTVPFADGTFEVIDLPPGQYVVETESSTEFDAGLSLAHAALDGRDVTDLPIDLSAGQALGGLGLVLSESLPSLDGRLEDDDPERIRRSTIVILPADASRRYPGSRRVRTMRPDTTGCFIVEKLPTGNYLIALVDEPMPETIHDMRFLEELVPTATPVTVPPEGVTEVVVRRR